MHPDCSCNEPQCFGSDDRGDFYECDDCPFWEACGAPGIAVDLLTKNTKTNQPPPPPQTPVKEKVKDMSHQVQKTFSVCTAHRLMDHPGACKNLHGHNYNITVYFEAGGLNDQGMVIDFSAIKETVGKMINELYDHKTVLQDTDPLVDVLSPYMFASLQTMPCAPTAENMAKQVLHKAQSVIAFGVRVVRVDVEETKNSIAIYVE